MARWAGASELHLTALEQSLLYLLAANAGRLLTRDEILDHLWGVDYVAESNVVDRHVRSLWAWIISTIVTAPRRTGRTEPPAGTPAPAQASAVSARTCSTVRFASATNAGFVSG